jgi:hypothetical protein
MKISKAIQDHLPWAIIAICVLEILLTWSRPAEAFAWIIATVGWIAYKIET